MKRRLLVARALVNEPDLVVLDEPTTGLDPQARLAVWRALERLRRRGVTLLLTTHYMEEAARLCDRLLIMDHGRIVAEGEPGGAGARARRARGARAGARRRAATPRRCSPRSTARLDGHELADDALMLYADDAEELLRALDHERFPTDSALVRRATLEDVFLRLTGRSLTSSDGDSREQRYAGLGAPLGRGDLVPSPRHAASHLAVATRASSRSSGRGPCCPSSSIRSSTSWRSASGSAPTSRSGQRRPVQGLRRRRG